MRRRFFKTSEDVISNYLTIEALEDGLTVSLLYSYCLYCINGDKQWKLLDTNGVTINSGQTISFKNAAYSESFGCGIFNVNKKINLVGNVMSMLVGDNAKNIFDLSNYPSAFRLMFSGCHTLQSVAPNLLPATTLASYCYNSMFYGCTSLVNAPELPATTLAGSCYNSMFYGCSKLNYIKALFTTTPNYSYTNGWVSGVSPTGTFVKNPDATWDVVGVDGVPEGWTVKFDGEEDGGG